MIMEIEKKLKELREKRNNLSAEISKCQEEIDKLELEKYDTQRFLWKILDLSGYIRIRSSECWLCYFNRKTHRWTKISWDYD